MAKKLGEYFTELAVMAGIDAEDPRLKALQSIVLEVPDDLVADISKKITTIEAAKNNPSIKSFFTQGALHPIDELMDSSISDAGFSADVWDAIKLEARRPDGSVSTPKKLRAFIDGLKKLKTAAPDKSPEKAALQTEIEKLQALLANAGTEKTTAISAAQKQANEQILEYAIDSVLSVMPYANKDIDHDVNVLTAKGVIQKALSDKKAKVVRLADNSLKLVQSENPDLDYFNEQHQPVKFTDFTKATLAAKKMLTTSEVPPANQRVPIIIPGQQGTGNPNLVTALDKQIAELNAVEA